MYDNLYKQFNPTKFDANQWASLFKASGAKYVVLTCKHHDGFCLWNTKLTDYNIMNTPFKRDITKELSTACRKDGIAFGSYYSVADWYDPDFPFTGPGGRVQRPTSDIDAYNKYLLAQTTELIQNYGPLITIWNDHPRGFRGRGVDTIKLARTLQPDILINNRTGDGGDYSTPEQNVGSFNMQQPWESCMTVSAHDHWSWGGDADGVKPLSTILGLLADCAGGDGNMLLDVGPQPDGAINAEQAERLSEIGKWLAVNGESIYGTRGGPWKPTKSVASTRNGNDIYVHILTWPPDPTAPIKLTAINKTVISARLLGGGSVSLTQSGATGDILLNVPESG